MKRIYLLLFVLLLSQLSHSQDKVYSTKEKRKEFIKELTLKYGDSDCRYIFNSDKIFEFEQWLDGNKESILIEDYPTVIHELFHGLSESSDSYQILYLDSAYLTKYNYEKAFNSKELNSVVRKGLQDSILRYGIYVAGLNKLPDGKVDKRLDQEASSVGYGIYGMFEEFCAYYHGAKASFLLFAYYDQKYGKKDNEAWKDYMSNVKGDLAAFFEFRIFMSYYIKHARNKHKDVYDKILKNTEFRAAFTLFEIRFTKLYDEYYRLESEINKFQKQDPTENLDQFDFSGSNEALYKFLCMADVEVANELFELKDGKYVFVEDEATLNEIKKQYNEFCKQLKPITKSSLLYFMANRNPYEKFVKKEYEAVKNELDVLRIKELNESNYSNYLKKVKS